jgi:CRISPR-associated protein Cmr2
MSAGILMVHYKHPLYDALDKARELEKKAKEMGRNAFAVGYLNRSGSYDEVVANWNVLKSLTEICVNVGDKNYHVLELIKRSKHNKTPCISERLTYHVVQEIDSLPEDEGAIVGFLKYELSRHYHDDDRERRKTFVELASKKIVESFNPRNLNPG